MRNNPAFIRVVDYITTNNITKAQILAASDAQFLAVMFPPDGVRPEADYTRVDSIKKALAHVYRERKQAARVADILSRIESEYPGVTVESLGDGKYLVSVGSDD